jgi:hypothetical protein
MKFGQTDVPSVAAAKSSMSAATVYRFEHDRRLPSQHEQTRGLDPFAHFLRCRDFMVLIPVPSVHRHHDAVGVITSSVINPPLG